MERPIRTSGGNNPAAVEEEEIGRGDVTWFMKIRAGLDAEPLPATLVEAALPMLPLLQECPHLHDLNEDLLVEHLENCVTEMDAKLPDMEQGEEINPEFAGCINSYTEESVPLYRVMSGELHTIATRLDHGELSERVKQVLPYCKFLDTSLKSLPSSYVYTGRAYRGVKWAFPSLKRHGSLHKYFPRGKKVRWFEVKSLTYDLEFLRKSGFCGEFGARTIFEVEVAEGFKIQEFSKFDEKEILLPMLTELEVVQAKNLLRLDPTCFDKPYPENVNSSSHTGEPDLVALDQKAPRHRLSSSCSSIGSFIGGWEKGYGGGKTAYFSQMDEAAKVDALRRAKRMMVRGEHFGQAFLTLQQLTNSSTAFEDFDFHGCGEEALTEFFAFLDDEIKAKILEGTM